MTDFPKATDKKIQLLLNDSREDLLALARQMKIDDLNENFFEEIVIPISLYFHHRFLLSLLILYVDNDIGKSFPPKE